jgi:hypothetical protein
MQTRSVEPRRGLEDNAHEIRLLPVASLSFTSVEIMDSHEHPTNVLDKHLYAQRKRCLLTTASLAIDIYVVLHTPRRL